MAISLLSLCLWLCLACVAIYDARQRRIPNNLNLVVFLVAALIFIFDSKLKWGGLAANFLIVFVIFFPGYVHQKLGAGDIKLLTGLSFCWSPLFLLWSVLIGIVITLATMVSETQKERLPTSGDRELSSDDDKTKRLPLGSAVFVGGAIALALKHTKIIET